MQIVDSKNKLLLFNNYLKFDVETTRKINYTKISCIEFYKTITTILVQ